MAAITYLSVDDVIQIHGDTIENEGGASGLRDINQLEAAVMMPRQTFGGTHLHEGLAAMAAAYLFHICQSHAFMDGNKRTAVLSALVFLDANEHDQLPDPSKLEAATLRVASGTMSKDDLTVFMREQCGIE